MMSFACLVSSCISDDFGGADLHVGDSLPEFSVTMDDGTMVSSSSLKGSVSCVVFFHTGCPDCRGVMPAIQRLYDEFSPSATGLGHDSGLPDRHPDVAFVLISRAEDAESVAGHWREEGFTMPYSAQKDKAVYHLFASEGVPRIYLSDKDCTIRFIHTDDPVPTYDMLAAELSSLL